MPEVADEVETETSQLLIHELLDRYEILYPNITELADLRRAVIDQDLSSIFISNFFLTGRLFHLKYFQKVWAFYGMQMTTLKFLNMPQQHFVFCVLVLIH